MISFPNAKINLGLNIIAKRTDGFHEVETCIYPIPFSDVLEIVHASDGVFSIDTSGIEIPADGRPNLCERAYNLLECPPVKIFLHKTIPPGSGLGAGSSNAAATLVTLNQIFDLGHNEQELKNKAANLGSDCPYFIQNMPAIATGRGEILEPCRVNLSGFLLALITPGFHVSTALAYSLIKPEKTIHAIQDTLNLPVNRWKEFLKNDFEPIVFEMHPALGEIKNWFYENGAVYASMSGSGSAIYGIFDQKIDLHHYKGIKPLVFNL